jgi:hypothetical protein
MMKHPIVVSDPSPTDRRTFETGAVRGTDTSELRFDLISPIALIAVARTCGEGSIKYGDFNWEKGIPVNNLLNHAIRHIYLYLSGDRNEAHLAHATWNLMAAIHTEVTHPEINKNLRSSGCIPPEFLTPCTVGRDKPWDVKQLRDIITILEDREKAKSSSV